MYYTIHLYVFSYILFVDNIIIIHFNHKYYLQWILDTRVHKCTYNTNTCYIYKVKIEGN